MKSAIHEFLLSVLIGEFHLRLDPEAVGDEMELGPNGLNLESLTLVDLAFRIEDRYGFSIPEDERDARVQATADTCIVDSDYFVRGVIEIPVHDYEPGFGFGVWVSHKKENFQAYVDHPDSDGIGPFFGWLSTRLDYYEADTLNLPTMAHYRKGGLRPNILLDPDSSHEIALDQRYGITLEKALEIVHHYTDERKP